MRFPEIGQDYCELQIFFLHFLMMTAALLSLSGPDELLHRLEDLVSPTHVAVHEVLIVQLQEPVILLIFLQ